MKRNLTVKEIEECIVYCFLEQWVDIADQRIAFVMNRGEEAGG